MKRAAASLTTAQRACRVIQDLADAGAILRPHDSASGLEPGVLYELQPGGDRSRCRQLIAAVKGDAPVWAELVAEIHRRAREAA